MARSHALAGESPSCTMAMVVSLNIQNSECKAKLCDQKKTKQKKKTKTRTCLFLFVFFGHKNNMLGLHNGPLKVSSSVWSVDNVLVGYWINLLY